MPYTLEPSVVREVERKFAAADVPYVLEKLRDTPLPMEQNGPAPRVHLAVVWLSAGDRAKFDHEISGAACDWRDTLTAAGLADEDWPDILRDKGIDRAEWSTLWSADPDAIVFDAVRYHRYHGATNEEIKRYFGGFGKHEPGGEILRASLERLETAEQIGRVGERWLLHPTRFRTAGGDSQKPEFTFEDVWILLGLLIMEGELVSLRDLMGFTDFIGRSIPTLDEFHGALNRLKAGRLISTRKGAFAATQKALDLYAKVEASCNRDPWARWRGLWNLINCPCCGVRLKRVTWPVRLTAEEVDAAHEAYSADMRSEKK